MKTPTAKMLMYGASVLTIAVSPVLADAPQMKMTTDVRPAGTLAGWQLATRRD